MYIQSLEWIDREIREAEVTVSDGCISVVCFAHPFNKNVNERITAPLHCLVAGNIARACGHVCYAKKIGGAFGYSICGKLVDRNGGIVALGNIRLCLDGAYIPADILGNSYIEFCVSRLDIY